MTSGVAAAGYGFSILFLKIAQRFNAGAMASTPDKVPPGTKGASSRNGVCEQSTILSSLTGLGFLLSPRPSVKTLGYCRAKKGAKRIRVECRDTGTWVGNGQTANAFSFCSSCAGT